MSKKCPTFNMSYTYMYFNTGPYITWVFAWAV